MSISINKVKQIIKEELSKLNESEDHAAFKVVVNSSIDLLKALDTFEAKATESQKSAVSEIITNLRTHLTSMQKGADAYTDSQPNGPKRVVFKKDDSK